MPSIYDRVSKRTFKSLDAAKKELGKHFVRVETLRKQGDNLLVSLVGTWEQVNLYEPCWVWKRSEDTHKNSEGKEVPLFSTPAVIYKNNGRGNKATYHV